MAELKAYKGKLKPYMAFSRNAGPHDGAILVIAHTARQARLLAWQSGDCLNVEDWLDQAVLLLKGNSPLVLADQTKLRSNEPHVIDCPAHCQECELWGCGITVDNLCAHCNCPPGDKLLGLYHSYQVAE